MKVTALVFLAGFSLILSGCAASGPKRVDGELAFSPESLVTMAESFAQAGDYGNALRLYQRAVSENPEHLGARSGLAKTYQSLGAVDAAIAMYRSILQQDPQNPEAMLGLGQMLVMKNEPEEALEYLKQVSARSPGNYRVYNILGLAYDLLGQHEKAQLTYGKGLAIVPDNISLLNNLGLSFTIQGQYAPGLRLLSKAVTQEPGNMKARENLVMAYVLSGEENQARNMAASFMDEEQLALKMQRYAWLKELESSQRAQAIFLGKTYFPKSGTEHEEAERVTTAMSSPATQEPVDPKKKRLREILAEEGREKSLTQGQATENNTGPVSAAAPVAQTNRSPAEDSASSGNLEPDIPAHNKVAEAGNEETDESNPVASSKRGKVYRVQIGSFISEEMARAEWRRLVKNAAAILKEYTPLIRAFSPDGEKQFYRLFVYEIEDRPLAREVCQRLEERKIGCLVIFTER